MTQAPAALQFTLFSRAGCTLCEEMLEQFLALPQAAQWQVVVLDVDADPGHRSRYGHKIPVLALNGELVCHGRLDTEELLKAVSLRHPTV